jgi:hypothetical protein
MAPGCFTRANLTIYLQKCLKLPKDIWFQRIINFVKENRELFWNIQEKKKEFQNEIFKIN